MVDVTCFVSEFTLKEGAPTMAIEQVMATMQRPRLGDLFAFCGSFSVRIKQWSLNVPHINDVSTNVLFICRNHIFLHVWTRSPQKIRTLLKNVLCIPKSMRATAELIMSVRSGLGSWKTDEKPNSM